MYFLHDSIEARVSVLYGFQTIIDRGISFSRSEEGNYGFVDRGVNGMTSVMTLQGDKDTMTTLASHLSTAFQMNIALEPGEKVFGPSYSYTATEASKTYIYCPLLNVGKLTRKELNLYTISVSLAKPTSLAKDPQYDLSYTPSWDTDIRYSPGYTTGNNANIKVRPLLSGVTSVSTISPEDYSATISSEMTDKELAQWHNSVVDGDNRIYNSVVANEMAMDLFGTTEYSTLSFFIKSFTYNSVSFNKWNVHFELLLNKKLSE